MTAAILKCLKEGQARYIEMTEQGLTSGKIITEAARQTAAGWTVLIFWVGEAELYNPIPSPARRAEPSRAEQPRDNRRRAK